MRRVRITFHLSVLGLLLLLVPSAWADEGTRVSIEQLRSSPSAYKDQIIRTLVIDVPFKIKEWPDGRYGFGLGQGFDAAPVRSQLNFILSPDFAKRLADDFRGATGIHKAHIFAEIQTESIDGKLYQTANILDIGLVASRRLPQGGKYAWRSRQKSYADTTGRLTAVRNRQVWPEQRTAPNQSNPASTRVAETAVVGPASNSQPISIANQVKFLERTSILLSENGDATIGAAKNLTRSADEFFSLGHRFPSYVTSANELLGQAKQLANLGKRLYLVSDLLKLQSISLALPGPPPTRDVSSKLREAAELLSRMARDFEQMGQSHRGDSELFAAEAAYRDMSAVLRNASRTLHILSRSLLNS